MWRFSSFGTPPVWYAVWYAVWYGPGADSIRFFWTCLLWYRGTGLQGSEKTIVCTFFDNGDLGEIWNPSLSHLFIVVQDLGRFKGIVSLLSMDLQTHNVPNETYRVELGPMLENLVRIVIQEATTLDQIVKQTAFIGETTNETTDDQKIKTIAINLYISACVSTFVFQPSSYDQFTLRDGSWAPSEADV